MRQSKDYRWLGGVLLLALPVIFWALNASRPGGQIEGCPSGCAAGERQPGPLRVISLNILHDFPRYQLLEERLNLVASEIRRLDADIVLLQEVSWTLPHGSAASTIASQVGMNYLYQNANGNRWAIFFEEGEAILSRFPLSHPIYFELEPRPSYFEHRIVLTAIAATPWGDVRLFATHLSHRDEQVNQAQAALLQKLVASFGPVTALVAGDFNALEDSPQIRALPWIDVFRAAHPEAPGYSCCLDDLTQPPGDPWSQRIDYLFLIPGARQAQIISIQPVLHQPVQTAQGWLWASDHSGWFAEIEFK